MIWKKKKKTINIYGYGRKNYIKIPRNEKENRYIINYNENSNSSFIDVMYNNNMLSIL